MQFPYTFTSCLCTDIPSPTNGAEDSPNYGEDREMAIDSRAARAAFSLYPIEHLLYCEDCQQIRCPRCTIEEIVCWYCPNCLFEMPASMVKSEQGRCNRSCFSCPVCTAPLAVNSIHPNADVRGAHGPWILSCQYCRWSSMDIGWQFEKPSGIQSQIDKLDGEGHSKPTRSKTPSESETSTNDEPIESPHAVFSSLQSFYSSQLSDPSSTDPLLTPSGGYSYSSPSSLARIMSLYTGRGTYGKKEGGRNTHMRESTDALEGLHLTTQTTERETIQRLHSNGWTSTNCISQQEQRRYSSRFVEDLKPIQIYLRTKRSKRCRTCRHILVKPESKVQSTRFKIKLVALNYIPTLALKPLQPAPSSQLTMTRLEALPVGSPNQFLLTLKNPLFEQVRITLATPTHTPGYYSHRVTILCPQFTIGPNVDQWDEALGNSKDRRSSKTLGTSKAEHAGGDGGRLAEAGKVWEKGRNWTTVVLEVVCAAIRGIKEGAKEDEDLLEIPLYIRMEWETDIAADGGVVVRKTGEGKEKRELSYWVVIGVGKVARHGEVGQNV